MMNIAHSSARAGLIVGFPLIAVLIGLLIVDPTGIFKTQAGSFGPPVGFVLVGVLGLVPFFLTGLKRWQWGIYALIYYMPFSGLPGILLNPYVSSGATTLIKDFVFAIPAYLGFAWWYRSNAAQLTEFPREMKITLILMAIVASFVLAHMFNPQLASYLLGLIGLKVWLFYMPLYVLGYYLIDEKSQLVRMATILLGLGMIPTSFGIVQAQLVYSGNGALAYALYGSAAAEITQLFARFDEAGGTGLVRIPSLFIFPLQYSSFLLTLLAVCYGLWTGSSYSRQMRTIYALALGAIVIALTASGARAVYVLLPGFLLLALLLSGKSGHRTKAIASLLTLVPLALGAMIHFLQSTLETFLSFVSSVVEGYLGMSGDTALINQFGYAPSLTWVGMGPGMNTGPARHALGQYLGSSYVNVFFDTGIESFQGKTIVEIGVPGLIAVAALFGWLLVSSHRQIRKLKDPSLRGLGVSLFAFLVVVVAYLYKGAVLDFDPLNVFFWLFAGILLKLPALEKGSV
jgi:hypothetical protein